MRQPPIEILRIRDFSGGVNQRDAAAELQNNEATASLNVKYDERGGVISRLGREKWNTTAFSGTGGVVVNTFYSELLADVVTQAGADMYFSTTNTVRKTWTTSARVVFCDFAGRCYAGHPVDGLFQSTDGITWTALADADRPLTCAAIAAWQNKLWVAEASSARIRFSDAGDGLVWTAASFVDLREKDTTAVVALAGASGIDISGRPGLLAFKPESAYRIYDSTTGAFDTIDSKRGAANAISVASHGGRTYAISEHGVWSTDGIGAMRDHADRLEPLWDSSQINLSRLDLFAAGVKGNHLQFSMPRAGSTSNDLCLEIHADQGWIAPGSNTASCYTTYGLNADYLLGGHPTTSGRVYRLEKTGADDAVAISSYWQSKWFEPADGRLCRLRRIRVYGRAGTNTITAIVLKDYDTTGGEEATLVLNEVDAELYDTGLTYDSGLLYGVAATQVDDDILSPGVCRAMSLRVEASTTGTGSSSMILGAGTAPETGAYAIYGFDLHFLALEN